MLRFLDIWWIRMAVISILNAAAMDGYPEIVPWNKKSRHDEMWFSIQQSITIDSWLCIIGITVRNRIQFIAKNLIFNILIIILIINYLVFKCTLYIYFVELFMQKQLIIPNLSYRFLSL